MADAPFDAPKRVAINRVYTGTGDRGRTALVGGQKVPKSSDRIASYGEVDELNSFVGSAAVSVRECLASGAAVSSPLEGVDSAAELERLLQTLRKVQHQLFNLGSILATLPEDVHPKQPRVRDEDAEWLEAEMDRCNAHLEPLRSFVLPGPVRLNTDLHVCRTVSRRVERQVCGLAETESVDSATLVYLNRLSDAFFVWSRWVNALLGADETVWEPNLGSN